MPPEEIAWKIVEKWWPLSATMMGDIRLREAIASAIRAEREMADSDLNAGRELMRQAWHEFNAIRARDGAPIGVSPEWWDEMTDRLGSLLGSDAVPWMTGAAKALLAPERARAEAAEAERDRLRAERDSLMMRVNHGTPKDACYSTDDDPNCPLEHLWITRNGALRAERDRLREALERIMTNEVRAHHDFRIDACHIAREALARAKGESDG